MINSEVYLADVHFTTVETVEGLIRQLKLELSDFFKMTVTVPAELNGRYDLAMTNGQLVCDVILLSPALAYKTKIEKA